MLGQREKFIRVSCIIDRKLSFRQWVSAILLYLYLSNLLIGNIMQCNPNQFQTFGLVFHISELIVPDVKFSETSTLLIFHLDIHPLGRLVKTLLQIIPRMVQLWIPSVLIIPSDMVILSQLSETHLWHVSFSNKLIYLQPIYSTGNNLEITTLKRSF